MMNRVSPRDFWLAALVLVGLSLLVAAVLAVAYFGWSKPPAARITPAAVQSIKAGMTRMEVEKLLGGPPGEYATDVTVEELPEAFVTAHARAGTGNHWIGHDAAVFV